MKVTESFSPFLSGFMGVVLSGGLIKHMGDPTLWTRMLCWSLLIIGLVHLVSQLLNFKIFEKNFMI